MATERYDKRTDNEEDHDYFKRYAEIILPKVKGSVLDIGCGQGWLTKLMAEKAESVTAIDKFDDQPECNQDPKVHYLKGNLPEALPTRKFDTTVSTEFIEHITEEQLEILLDMIDGHFLGSTPNVPVHSGNKFHLREYTSDEIKELFSKHGFTGDYYEPLPYLLVWDVWKK